MILKMKNEERRKLMEEEESKENFKRQETNFADLKHNNLVNDSEKEKRDRINRCLNVLREAANEMVNIGGKQAEEILDIDYYEKDKEDKEDQDSDCEILIVNKGKNKKLKKMNKAI